MCRRTDCRACVCVCVSAAAAGVDGAWTTRRSVSTKACQPWCRRVSVTGPGASVHTAGQRQSLMALVPSWRRRSETLSRSSSGMSCPGPALRSLLLGTIHAHEAATSIVWAVHLRSSHPSVHPGTFASIHTHTLPWRFASKECRLGDGLHTFAPYNQLRACPG